ncbi:hypothetical protein [Paraburkholderia sp. BL23I1N1]|uniref:hypothetical protein n=1 Tax=Paraburkholderia sp. BL23I1N1 TaxID=1938802 RepID=UPI001602B33F
MAMLIALERLVLGGGQLLRVCAHIGCERFSRFIAFTGLCGGRCSVCYLRGFFEQARRSVCCDAALSHALRVKRDHLEQFAVTGQLLLILLRSVHQQFKQRSMVPTFLYCYGRTPTYCGRKSDKRFQLTDVTVAEIEGLKCKFLVLERVDRRA